MTESAARRTYRTPPIEEALVEFRFVPAQEWDLTIPGKLHQHPAIGPQYPGKPRTQKVVEAELQAGPGQPPNFAVREGLGRIQLVSEDGRRLISLGTDLLSVNILRPYSGWEEFRPRIEAALRAYAEVVAPKAVARVGVRYINRILLAGTELDLAAYFRCGPTTPPGLPERMAGFVSRVEYAYDDGAKLLLMHARLGASAGSAFLLDLDVIWEGLESLPMNRVMSIVDDLHEREGQAFEAAITDKTRAVFDDA
ncbi:MAG TPA: TIGR04255 family protein [Candidatus Binatia bacterium]|nr:TIGR04255 family protein [Candidatus Binatia bacterium]